MIIKTSYPFMKPPPSARLIRGHRLSQGLAGLWPFGEGGDSKQVSDLSGNGYNLTASGSPTWVPGKFGSATRYVAASNQYFSGDYSPITALPYTVCCWVKAGEDNPAALRCFFFYGDLGDDANYLSINFETNGTIRAWSRHEGASAFTTIDYADGNWHFVVVVVTNPVNVTLDLYVDDEPPIQHVSGGATIINTFNKVTWGMLRDFSPSQAFEGDIDNGMIYNRALSASEIAELYLRPFGMFERKARTALLSGYEVVAPPVGMAGAMTTNTGYWGW